MNIIEALRNWESGVPGITEHQEYLDACDEMIGIVAQYNALAPNWDDAPDWTQWYAIDADGDGRFREYEPEIFREESRWYGIALEGHIHNDLPLGIDWRLCKWQRPEVTG